MKYISFYFFLIINSLKNKLMALCGDERGGKIKITTLQNTSPCS